MNCRIICLLMLFPLSAFADQVQVYDAYSVQESLSLYREYSSLERAGSWYRDNLQLMAGLPEAEQDLWMQMMEENLLDRIEREFDQNLSFTGGGRFQNLLEDLNLRWTYQMDGDSVLFDSAGDPLLRSTDRADIEADKTSWKESVEALAEDVLVRWSKNAETLLSSFTSAMTDEFRSRVEDTLTVTMDSWCRMIQDENDRLIRWSSSRMDHRRQRDSYSSRIKSEALSAENLADSLIDDIRDELQESEEALRQGLGINYSVSGELDGDSSDWESLFRKEFTRGLEKWSEAEESFLSERLNWELRAGAEYAEAEEAWSEGLTLFAKSREMWIQDMSRILEEGTVLRDEGIAAARLEISRIAGDIEEAVREEEKKFAGQVEAALGLYRDSLSLMDSVDDNLDYYSRQAEECRSALSRGGSSAKRGLLKKELAFYLEEYTQWRGFRENLVLQIEDARGMLRELELSVAAYNPTVGAGTLDRDIEDLRSRTDRLYREWMISEAVAAYAGENSSLRDTEAESLANLRRAEGILDKAESEYESALRGLAELKDDLVSAEGSIRSVQLRLAEAREEAQRALEEYESTLSIYSSEDMEVLERSISGLREAVESWTGGEEPGRVLIYSEYLSALEHERRLDIGYSGSVDKLKEKFAEFCSGDSENLLSELQALSGADEFLNFLTPLVQEALLPEALESLFIAYGAVRFTEASEYGQDAGDSLAAVEAVLDKAALLESEDDLSAWMTGDEVLMIAREAGWQDLSEVTPEQMLIRLEEYRYSLDREYTRTLLSERMETVRGTGSLFGDADFLEYSLYTALSLVFSETPDPPAGSSDELYEVYLENVNLINGYQEKIEALEAGMALCIEGRDLYKEDILDPKLQVYLKKKKAVEELLLTYRTAASQFDGLQAEYIAAQQELDTLYSACQNAAYVRQEALEILDYASGVYSPGEMSIYTVLEERREKYSNSLEALNILEDLAAGGRGKDDETLALLIREKGDLLSALNIIVYTEQQLSEELVQLRNDRSSAENTMQAECESLIDFSFRDGLSYCYDQSYLEQGMSSFSSWNNGSLAGSINNYFSQSDSSEIFTRDLLLWFEGISSYGSTADLLKTFSFTYYHELREMEGMSWDKIRSTYTVDLFNDPRHQDLLDTDGTLFTSVRIGYEGVVDRYLRGEYETVEKTYYSLVDQGISKVFISGEEWLAEACGLFSIRKRKDPKFKNLYAFYKMLMYSDAMATSEMRTAMEKDLSRVAWKYIDSQAKTQQDKFKRLLFKGYRKKGRDIKDKRETLAETASAYNGISKRSKLSRSAAAASSALEKLDWIEKRETTLGSGTLETADQFFSLLTSLGNVDISGDPGDCITSAFEDLSDDQRSSPAAVLEAVKTVLETGFVSNNRSITERRTELAREKSALAASMESLLHGNNWDNDAFTQAAQSCYLENAYSPDKVDAVSIATVIGSENPGEFESFYTLETYGRELAGSFHNRLAAVAGDRIDELKDGLSSLYREQEYWQTLIAGLNREGLRQWALSYNNLISERKEWRRRISQEMIGKSSLWEDRYSEFLRNKERWIQRGTDLLISSSVEGFAREWDLDADRLISASDFRLVSDLNLQTESAGALIYKALNGQTLSRLLDSAEQISSRETEFLPASASILQLPNRRSAFLEIRENNTALENRVIKGVSLSRAGQLLELIRQMDSSVEEQLAKSNESVDRSIDDELSNSGYVRQGNSYSRTVLIDSSLLGGNETERQSLEGFSFYKAPGFNPGINLTKERLSVMDGFMIQASVDLMQDELTAYMAKLFGDPGDENALPEDSLFQTHLGYVPEMDENDPEKVKKKGAGEYGKIFKKYFVQQARLYRGLASVNTPWYGQKLWDDDADNDGESDGFLGAPSVRTLADISLSVTAGIFTSGFGLVMLNLVDDALFTLIDAGRGLVDFGEASLSFLKKAGSSLLSAGIGQVGDILDKTITGTAGILEVGSDMAIKGLTYTGSSYGSAALYSLDLEDGWNQDTFDSMTSWDNYGAGLVTSLAGTVVTETLNLGSYGFDGDMADNTNCFSSLAGGLTASGLEYALSGETTLNVMNLGKSGSGFLEMNIGEEGSLFNFGTGGTDVSINTLYSSALGISVFAESLQISQTVEDRDLRAGMRTLVSAGFDETTALYNDIMEGRAVLQTNDSLKHQGRTSVDGSGIKVIDLNKDGMSRLDLAVLLGHEAYRDGTTGTENEQILETIDAGLGHMAISSALQQRYGMESLNSLNNAEATAYNLYDQGIISRQDLTDYIEDNYDSSADYWKIILNNDGKVQKVLEDGDRNTLIFTNEAGEVLSINRVRKGSLSGQIADIASVFQSGDDRQNQSDVNRVMVASGLDYDDTLKWHAIRDDAYDYGSDVDPLYEAIRRNDYSYLEKYHQNGVIDISQEIVEKALGLPEHSACALTAEAEFANNYFQTEYGVSLDQNGLLDALREAGGEMFDKEGKVLSYNGLNAVIAEKLGLDNYPVFKRSYNSFEELQAAGIESFVQKFVHVDDKERMHFASWSAGVQDDPFTSFQEDRWWKDKDLYSTEYYSFTSKY